MRKFTLQLGSALLLCVAAAFFLFKNEPEISIFLLLTAALPLALPTRTLFIGNGAITEFSELDKTKYYTFLETRFGIVILDLIDSEEFCNIRVRNFPRQHRNLKTGQLICFSADGTMQIGEPPYHGHIKHQSA